MTLVSIVTPTMAGRERLLLDRCHPSVAKQDWAQGDIEHVVVADQGTTLRDGNGFRLVELNDAWRNGRLDLSHGAFPWMIGCLLAKGAYVGFLGDDDELEPDHVRRHVEAMEDTGADFTVSAVRFYVDGTYRFVIGDDSFAHAHLDADGVMCRASALRTANWDPTPTDPAGVALLGAADYRLVRDWQAGGLKGHFLGGEPTAIHHDGWAAG